MRHQAPEPACQPEAVLMLICWDSSHLLGCPTHTCLKLTACAMRQKYDVKGGLELPSACSQTVCKCPHVTLHQLAMASYTNQRPRRNVC